MAFINDVSSANSQTWDVMYSKLYIDRWYIARQVVGQALTDYWLKIHDPN